MKIEDALAVALAYAQDRLGHPPDPRNRVKVSPDEVLELLWDFHPLFTPRFDVISSTPHLAAFETEADGALLDLARTDEVAGWDGMSAGAWRIIADRLFFLETVVMINIAAREKVFTSIPLGLDRRSRGKFVLLLLLLGEARTIPPDILSRSARKPFPGFPQAPVWRQ